MKNLHVVANWKANKTAHQAIYWLDAISNQISQPKADSPLADNKKVIVCPPFLAVSKVAEYVRSKSLPIEIGVQDVSRFDEGPFTGEVSASQVKEFATYVIIGHSERRENFGEDDALLKTKVTLALKNGLMPIFCVQDSTTFIPEGVRLVAYEPIGAIGTGKPDTPENSEEVAKSIKSSHPEVTQVLYGGSVKAENIASFTQMPHIDGVLVGGASLEEESFLSLLKAC